MHRIFHVVGIANRRLHENNDAGRGCGGVGVVWHKSLDAALSQIASVESDSGRVKDWILSPQ